MPDITSLEARMVAAYLLLIRKDLPLIDQLEKSIGSDHCPLFDPDNPHHCTVYGARPLICRLFGACASTTKEGVAEFRHCKYNDAMTMSRCVFGVCFPLYVSLLAFLSYQDAVVLRYPVLVALVAFIPVTILFLWCPNRRKTIMEHRYRCGDFVDQIPFG